MSKSYPYGIWSGVSPGGRFAFNACGIVTFSEVKRARRGRAPKGFLVSGAMEGCIGSGA